ncbi:MAG: hypothetical protein ISS23_01725 [Nanoarchaeota archaeon]|nr:hypothetical protein [Nanoarchaeota archaeon]
MVEVKQGDSIEGYCMKCKKKQVMKDPKNTPLKNGRDAVSGTCAVCGTKLFKIGTKIV